MAHSTLAVSSLAFFTPEDPVHYEGRRVSVWPESIRADQAAIEQARRELGPNADARKILDRAQEIKEGR